MKNVLITSAGKRVSLTRKFREELKAICDGGKVFTVDTNPQMAPACVLSDGCFKVPRCTSESYIQALLSICRDNNIGLIIPTIDIELAILSENKEDFERNGICVMISDYDFIMTCRDKRNTAVFFLQHDIKIPEPRDRQHPHFPMFAKPYDGSLSKGTHVILNERDFTEEVRNDSHLIFMDYIDTAEYKEFTVDMYYGRDNRVKSIVPRERIEIRAGEINKGITRKNFLVEYLKQRLCHIPGAVGSICIQLFYREDDHVAIGIEINPRFSGGYPLAYCAGANFPLMAIKEYLLGETVDYSEDWRDNTIMLRYDEEVIVYDE